MADRTFLFTLTGAYALCGFQNLHRFFISRREMKPQPVKVGTKVSETKSTTAAQSDVSEDDFKSPKYDDSGSDISSDSDSDSGSESGSDSEAGDSEIASASDSANSDSGGDSDSESDNSSGSSDEEALTSKKKELDQISKDVKMVSNLVSFIFNGLDGI